MINEDPSVRRDQGVVGSKMNRTSQNAACESKDSYGGWRWYLFKSQT